MARKKLDELVYEYIVHKIKTGEYLQKQHITEQEIVSDLKVSRTPVRKAFEQLVEDNYLENIENIGVHVKIRPMDSKGFQERMNLLENLLNYYLFEIEKKEICFEVEALKQINSELEKLEIVEGNLFEEQTMNYFRTLLTYNKNNYEKEIILRAIQEVLSKEGYISTIIKDSRKIIRNHLREITEHLEKNHYSLARREIRILSNQLQLNVIENKLFYK